MTSLDGIIRPDAITAKMRAQLSDALSSMTMGQYVKLLEEPNVFRQLEKIAELVPEIAKLLAKPINRDASSEGRAGRTLRGRRRVGPQSSPF